jgi:hypothetical protein
MMLKPLACAVAVVTVSLLTACSTGSISKDNGKAIVFTEPQIAAPFYALNPFDYEAPPVFEVELKKAAAQPLNKVQSTANSITYSTNRLIVPTINSKDRKMSYATAAGENQLDVTEIDDFLQLVEARARHYPPNFIDKPVRKGYEYKIKEINKLLEPLATQENASFDVLMRAFKASVMSRNLDLGSSYTTKSLGYAQRIQKINKEDPEFNFWFGFALSEGGGQREAIPYLDKAMKAGVQEAYLSATNNYIFLEQKKSAVQVLKNYKLKFPQEGQVIDRLIQEIEKQGRWNVWQVMATKK